jgi:hypothetical protein
MNIEQTKRMNFMIKELQKNGIVSQFADAINIAGGLYENAMPDSKEEAIPVTAQKAAYNQANGYSQVSVSQVAGGEQTVPQMVDRKIKYAKVEQEELFNQKLRQFYEHLQGIHAQYDLQIQELKAEVQRLRAGIPKQEQQMTLGGEPSIISGSAQQAVNETFSHIAHEQDPKLVQAAIPKSAASQNKGAPRSGDLIPDDVVLENYFYFGKN